MSISAVIGWQAACDYPGCDEAGPRCWTFDEAARDWRWRTRDGLVVQRPDIQPPVVMCSAHAMAACCRCGTRDHLAVTDTDVRRSWCASCWHDIADADLSAEKTSGVYAHQTGPERPGERQPDTKSEGKQS